MEPSDNDLHKCRTSRCILSPTLRFLFVAGGDDVCLSRAEGLQFEFDVTSCENNTGQETIACS